MAVRVDVMSIVVCCRTHSRRVAQPSCSATGPESGPLCSSKDGHGAIDMYDDRDGERDGCVRHGCAFQRAVQCPRGACCAPPSRSRLTGLLGNKLTSWSSLLVLHGGHTRWPWWWAKASSDMRGRLAEEGRGAPCMQGMFMLRSHRRQACQRCWPVGNSRGCAVPLQCSVV